MTRTHKLQSRGSFSGAEAVSDKADDDALLPQGEEDNAGGDGLPPLKPLCALVNRGYGKALMEYCLADAQEKGKSGVCMLGAKKQKAWLSDQSFVKKFSFEVVDATDDGYELLALSFDGTIPRFTQKAKKQEIEDKALTIYYDMQCPYIL